MSGEATKGKKRRFSDVLLSQAGLDLRPHNAGEPVQCCVPNAASWWLGNLRGYAPCGNKAPGFLFRPEMTCKTWPQERDRPL